MHASSKYVCTLPAQHLREVCNACVYFVSVCKLLVYVERFDIIAQALMSPLHINQMHGIRPTVHIRIHSHMHIRVHIHIGMAMHAQTHVHKLAKYV